jgi:hypothetical protein
MLTQALSAAAVPPLAHAAALSSTGMIVGRWPGASSTPEPCSVVAGAAGLDVDRAGPRGADLDRRAHPVARAQPEGRDEHVLHLDVELGVLAGPLLEVGQAPDVGRRVEVAEARREARAEVELVDRPVGHHDRRQHHRGVLLDDVVAGRRRRRVGILERVVGAHAARGVRGRRVDAGADGQPLHHLVEAVRHRERRHRLERPDADRRLRVVGHRAVGLALPPVGAPGDVLVDAVAVERQVEADQRRADVDHRALGAGDAGRVHADRRRIVERRHRRAGAADRDGPRAGQVQAAGAGGRGAGEQAEREATDRPRQSLVHPPESIPRRVRKARWVIKIETAAGVTPSMRAACPTDTGRSVDSFSTTSRDSPGMPA